MKKSKAIILSFILIMATVFSACSSPSDVVDSVKSDDSITAPKVEENVIMSIAWNEPWTNTSTNKKWPTTIAKEVFAKTGVTFDINGMDDEKFSVLLAGGDLPDMVVLQSAEHIKQLVEGDQVIDMENLVKTNGPDILKNFPDRLDLNKKFFSNNTNKLYFLSTLAGPSSPSYSFDLGYILRWDYYKELGYTKFTNQDELLPILIEMQKKHPTTDAGKKIYGMGYFNDWGIWAYKINCYREGYMELRTGGYLYTMKDEKLVNNYTDLNSPIWNTMRYMYKANKAGLLDPDSFTMKQADYEAKLKDGRYLTALSLWWTGGFNGDQIKLDPNTDKGYAAVPVEGSSSWNNGVTNFGKPKVWAITKNCKNPEKAMDLINYFYSTDGVRTVFSGVKGADWDVVDGKAQMLPDSLNAFKNSDQEFKDKVGFAFFNNNIGIGGGVKTDDGEIADLTSTSQLLKLRVNGAEKAMSQYFNVEYPNQAFDKLVAEGKMQDESKTNVDIENALIATPDEIKRIDAKEDEMFTNYIPKLVLAKSDAEFNAIQKKMLEEFKAAGSDQSETWYAKAFEDAKAAISK